MWSFAPKGLMKLRFLADKGGPLEFGWPLGFGLNCGLSCLDLIVTSFLVCCCIDTMLSYRTEVLYASHMLSLSVCRYTPYCAHYRACSFAIAHYWMTCIVRYAHYLLSCCALYYIVLRTLYLYSLHSYCICTRCTRTVF
jgi:hypothetical protein